MPRPPLPFVRHRTQNQIRAQYRACRHPVEKTRWHAIWLLSRADQPRTSDQVGNLVGLSGVTVRAVLHRWNESGPDGLVDLRNTNGAKSTSTTRPRAALDAAVQKRAPDGGLWTGPKVARYVRTRWQITVSPETGGRWRVELGFSLQVPRPSHPNAADPAARRAWKKTYGGG